MAKAKKISITSSVSLDPLAIGIDIGGTGTKFGIVDRNGNVLFSSEISTRGHEEVESFIEELHTSLQALIERAGGPGRIRGIGVGAPNGNYYTGTVEYAPNLPWKGIIPLAKLIQNKFQLPTVLTNEAAALFLMGIWFWGMMDLPANLATPSPYQMAGFIPAQANMAHWKAMRQQQVLH
jgi:predicted NBD/HSP70 family sugar kinase